MRYVKTPEGEIKDIYSEFPSTSFSEAGPDDLWLPEHNMAVLKETQSPGESAYIVYEENGAELISGEWELQWSSRAMSGEERAAFDQKTAAEISAYRDAKIYEIVSYEQDDIEYQVLNDDLTRAKLAETLRGMDLINDPEYTVDWETTNIGSVSVGPDIIGGLFKVCFERIQACFRAYNHVISIHETTPYATDSWKGVFDAQLEE